MQDVTVTATNGATVTDKIKVVVLPNITSIEIGEIETRKGEDKEVSFCVQYEDGSSKELSFMLSDTEKEYVDDYEIGTVTSNLEIAWSNNQSDETGVDYKTGGEYTISLNYNGVEATSIVKVWDSCLDNSLHNDFCSESCKTCLFIRENQSKFDEYIASIRETKELLQDNITALEQETVPKESEIISREKENLEALKEDFNTACESMNSLKNSLDEKIEEYTQLWNASSDKESLEALLLEVDSYKTNSREETVTTYQNASDTLIVMNELKEQKEAIEAFVPEITILGNLEKAYDRQPVLFEAQVTTAEFDSEFKNPVAYFLYNGTDWVELTKEQTKQFHVLKKFLNFLQHLLVDKFHKSLL